MAARKDGLARWVPLLLRIVLGGLFIAHGSQKLGLMGDHGIAWWASYFKSLGITPPFFWAWVVTLVEFFGGIAVFFGLLTRAACALIIIDMTVAIIKANWRAGFDVTLGGFELALTFGVIALALLMMGPGPFAVDRALGLEK